MRLKIAVLLSLLLLAITSDARVCNLIRLRSGISAGRRLICNCESWRLMVEVNNVRNWTVVPEECVRHVGEYMTKPDLTNQTQYASDLHVLSRQILQYLQELPPPAAGDTWLFDLIDTLISDVDYYSLTQNQFGGVPFNQEQYEAWLLDPASNLKRVVYMDEVFYAARLKGYKIVILSGLSIEYQVTFESKLKQAGFIGWSQLILNHNSSMPSREFKESIRAELLKNGQKVIGNVGDQWSDLQGGDNVGQRVFKVPNPMYYVK